MVRHQAQRHIAIHKRLPENSNDRASPATIIVSRREVGPEPYGLVIVVDGVVILRLGQIRIATIEVGFSGRLELHDLLVILDSAIELALAVVGDAPVVVRRRELPIEFDRLTIILDSAIEIALKPVGEPTRVEGFRNLLSGVARCLDNRRAAVDALSKAGAVLSLAPAALLHRLRQRGAGAGQ